MYNVLCYLINSLSSVLRIYDEGILMESKKLTRGIKNFL